MTKRSEFLLFLWLAAAAMFLGDTAKVFAQIALVNSIRTIVGTGTASYYGDGGAATVADLNQPGGIAVDAGRNFYIADTANHAVRRVDAVTGTITTFAGTGQQGVSTDGLVASSSQLSSPGGVAIDANGDVLIADTGNNRVVVVYEGGGTMSSLITAENPSVTTPTIGALYTVAGNGTSGYSGDLALAITGELSAPSHVAVDSQGAVYIADTSNQRVRVVYAGGAAARSYITSANSSVTTPTTGYIYTIVGTGTASSTGDGATAGLATLNVPSAVFLDLQNNLYIAEKAGNRVRAVYLSSTWLSSLISLEASGATATADFIYTIAGNGVSGSTGDGALAANANLNQPTGITVDAGGNLYIADAANGVVRFVSATSGSISTVAGSLSLGRGFSGDGGLATQGQIQTAADVALDSSNALYIADGAGGNRIRLVSAGTLFPATAVGATSTPQNLLLQFGADTVLSSIGVIPSGSITEYKLGSISSCPADGVTVIAAGTVCPIPVSFSPSYTGLRTAPLTLTASSGNQYAFPLGGLSVGAQAAVIPGKLSTVAGAGSSAYKGDGGAATAASLWAPYNVAVDGDGNVFINDNGNHRIRVVYEGGALAARLITLENPSVTAPVVGYIYTVAGNGSTSSSSADGSLASSTALSTNISGLAVDASDNVYFSDQQSARIRVVSSLTGNISTVAGVNGNPSSAANSGDYGLATNGKLYLPYALALDGLGNLYIDNGNYQIRKVSLATGILTTVAGVGTSGASMDGIPALSAKFTSLMGLYADSYGNLYVGDAASRRIAIIYGGGTSNPASSLILATHSTLIAPVAGYIYTVAGYGTSGYSGDGGLATAAKLGYFYQIAVDAAGNIYLSDKTDNYIRKVDGNTGIIRTIAGTGGSSAAGDGGASTSAAINSPYGMAVDGAGNVYIADGANARIRQITPAAYPLTFSSTTVGSASSAQSVLLSNIGNVGFTPISIGTTNSFAITGFSTCETSLTLAAGGSCSTYVTFTPQVNGTTTGSLTYAGNAASTIVPLSGTGTGGVSTTTTLTAPGSITYGQLIPVSATVAASGTPIISGTVTFSAGATTLGSAQLDSTGTATISLPTLGAGSYQLTATFAQNGVNMASSSTSPLTVNQAPLTITANDASIQYGNSLPTFTYGVSGLTNGDTAANALTGAPALSTTANSSSNAGTYPIVIGPGTLAAPNYSITFVNGTLTISGGVQQSITFASIANTVYGVSPFTVSPKATSTLPVTVSLVSGPATVSGSTVTITGAGTVVLQATQAGNIDYAAATAVTQSFQVAQAALSVVVKNATRAYGASDPAYTSTVTGLVNGDIIGGTLAVSYSSTDLASSPVGTYAIKATLSGPAFASYSITMSPGVLTITPAPLTMTVANASRTYGAANPTFSASLGGLVNGDSVGTTLSENLTTTASTTSPIGTYPITGTISGTSASQYSMTVIPGTLTVTVAGLTATADSTSRLYGAANPTLTGSYSGALNGDTFTESFTTSAVQSTNAGSYSIIPSLSGANIGNYSVSVSKGTITIYRANSALAITASGTTVDYGSSLLLTVTAISPTTGAPTGSVTLYDGAAVLGTATLNSGVATLTTSSLLLGSHSITASYSGDYDFYGSSAPADTITVIAPQYTVSASSSTLTVAAGGTVADTLTAQATGAYTGTLSFSCDNLPANMSCQFSPSSVSLDGTNTSRSVTLTIAASNSALAMETPRYRDIQLGGFALPIGALLLAGIGMRRRFLRQIACLALACFLFTGASLMTGCGGSPTRSSSTASGSYQVLVQAKASTGSSNSVSLLVNVQ